MQVQFFLDVQEFIESLEVGCRAKVLRTCDLLEKYGNALRMPYSRSLGHQLFELRIQGDEAVRLFYVFHNGFAVILHAYWKKSRKLPAREQTIALQRKKRLEKR